MDLWSPLVQYEEVFFHRNVNIVGSHYQNPTHHAAQTNNNNNNNNNNSNNNNNNSNNINHNFLYLNHILMGCNIFYLQRPLNRKEVAKYRLVLVQGTLKGRLKGMRLDPDSEIKGEILSTPFQLENTYTPLPLTYLLEVSGKSHTTGELEKWQLLTSSEATYTEWLEALRKAKSYADIAEVSNEAEKLRELAKRMKEGLVVRRRIQRFRLYDRTFVGISAVKWIMKDKQCTLSQAIAIGNRMLNLGFIFHVTNEHLLCPRNLLYRFSYEIDTYQRSNQTQQRTSISLFHRENKNQANATEPNVDIIDHRTWEEVTNENHRLLSSYHSLQRDLIQLKASYRDGINLLETFLHNITTNQSNSSSSSSSSSTDSTTYTKTRYLGLILMVVGFHLISILYSDELRKLHFDFYFQIFLIFCLLGIYCLYSYLFRRIYQETLRKNRSATLSNPNTYIDSLQEILKKLKKDKERFFSSSDEALNPITSPERKDHENTKLSSTRLLSVGSSQGRKYDQSKRRKRMITESEKSESRKTSSSKSNGKQDRSKPKVLKVEDDDSSYEEGDDIDEDEDDKDDVEDDYEDFPEEDEEADLEELAAVEDEEDDGEESDDDESASISISSELSNENHTRSVRSNLESRNEKTLLAHRQPQLWPNYPILVCRSPFMLSSKLTEHEKTKLLEPIVLHNHSLHSNPFIEIDNDYFIGKIYLFFDRITDAGSSERHGGIKEKKKTFQYVAQGRFKKVIPFHHVYTGNAYDEEIQQTPTKWLLSGIGKLQPGYEYNLDGSKPYFISPLMSTSQHVVISRRGQEPTLTESSYEDNISILGSEFQNMTEKKRKAFFAQRKNLEKYSYDPNFIYTFVFYQNLLNFRSFQIEVGFFKYDIVKILGVLPVQIMALYWPLENKGSLPDHWNYFYNFEVWHERSLTQLLKGMEGEDKLDPLIPPQLRSSSSGPADTTEDSPETKKRSSSMDFLHKITHPNSALTVPNPFGERKIFRKSENSSFLRYSVDHSNTIEDSHGYGERVTNKPAMLPSSSHENPPNNSNPSDGIASNYVRSGPGPLSVPPVAASTVQKRKTWLGKFK